MNRYEKGYLAGYKVGRELAHEEVARIDAANRSGKIDPRVLASYGLPFIENPTKEALAVAEEKIKKLQLEIRLEQTRRASNKRTLQHRTAELKAAQQDLLNAEAEYASLQEDFTTLDGELDASIAASNRLGLELSRAEEDMESMAEQLRTLEETPFMAITIKVEE